MSAFFEDLIVRLVPVAFPICLLIALGVHLGVLPDGTEKKSKGDSGGKPSKKEASKKEDTDKGGE